MKYFMPLDIDWEPVSSKLKHFVLENKNLIGYYTSGWKNLDLIKILHIYPDIIKMLTPLNALPTSVSLVVSYSNNSLIHCDFTEHNTRRILLPVLNCEYSMTRFYKSEQEVMIKYQNNGVPYYGDINPDSCELVDEFCLDRAYAIKPKELHNVVIEGTNFPRISCPININRDLDY